MEDYVSDNPEDAGQTHDMLDHTKFKLNDVVEIITRFGMCIVGLVVCNKYDVIRLADPCKVFFVPTHDTSSDKIRYTITIQPWRMLGDENFAQFKIDDISNITKVTSLEYIKLWDKNSREFAKFQYEFGEKR